jgi:hypothetical protein
MTVSRRLRFEVLRRDNLTCRYCGRSAPDVALTVDHVIPEALGGTDEPGNLATACSECNAGKSSIAPDSPIVEDVRHDAIRWQRAIKEAASYIAEDRAAQAAIRSRFDEMWCSYKVPDGPNQGQVMPRPAGWARSIDQFLKAGLPEDQVHELASVAMDSKAANANVWRYFCGCCWNAIRELQDAALSIIDAEETIHAQTGGELSY